MSNEVFQLAGTFVIALFTFLGVSYQVRANRRQVESGASKSLSDAAAGLIEPYRIEVIGLRAELEEQRRRRQDLADRLAVAVARVDKLERWIMANTTTAPGDINGVH